MRSSIRPILFMALLVTVRSLERYGFWVLFALLCGSTGQLLAGVITGDYVLNGETVLAPEGVLLQPPAPPDVGPPPPPVVPRVRGYGALVGKFVGQPGTEIRPEGGTLTLGDEVDDGFTHFGSVYVGQGNTLGIRSNNQSVLGGEVWLMGGVIRAPQGVLLGDPGGDESNRFSSLRAASTEIVRDVLEGNGVHRAKVQNLQAGVKSLIQLNEPATRSLGAAYAKDLLAQVAFTLPLFDLTVIVKTTGQPPPPPTGYSEWGTYVEDLEEKLNSVGDDDQLANVDLQEVLKRQQQTLTFFEDAAKMLNDTGLAWIRKIGGSSVYGNVENVAILAPNPTANSLEFFGDYAQGTIGVLEVQLGGRELGQYSRLDVEGVASLGLGTKVSITLTDSFDPAVGDVFDVLVADHIEMPLSLQTTDDPGVVFDLPSLDGGRYFEVSVVQSDGHDVLRLYTAIPEPATLVLLGVGAISLLRYAWRPGRT